MLLLLFLPQLVLSNKISDIHYSDLDFYSPSDSPKNNWTVNYGSWLTLPSLDFAAAAYSTDPSPCLEKHKAKLVLRVQVPCDAFRDECWAFIAISKHFIIFSVRGTQTQTQLIVEIIESMTGSKILEKIFFEKFLPILAPKKEFPAGGSVQHYFYESLQAIWNAGFGTKLAELKKPKELLLVTFGQPRVGNIEYAKLHRRLVPNSFRIVHRYGFFLNTLEIL
ncbi:unnamed protein product [Meloidogyne enterolobii]|uniref:Uncharacterized protein n=1 Tax=Meloidogyne enterolobii TaxID=390850 RepID=A0ACB0YQJ8_MELEN